MEIRDKVIDSDYIHTLDNDLLSSFGDGNTFVNCKFVYCFIGNMFKYCDFINCTFFNKTFFQVTFIKCTFENIIFKNDPRSCICDCISSDCYADEAFKQSFVETAPCPQTGSFIAWKKANVYSDVQDIIYPSRFDLSFYRTPSECIVELRIPEDARRSCGFSSKCRCDKAEVLGIYDLHGSPLPSNTVAYSKMDNSFRYTIGNTVTPREPFDTDPFNECSSGIHFFMSREEAVKY